MRIGIFGVIGAGAIDRSLSAMLARGSHEVQFAASGSHWAATRERSEWDVDSSTLHRRSSSHDDVTTQPTSLGRYV